jgi:hypothetical protein
MRGGDLDGAARSFTAAIGQHSVVPEHRVNLAYDYLMLARVASARGDGAVARRAATELLGLLPRLGDEDRRVLTPPTEELKTKVGLP